MACFSSRYYLVLLPVLLYSLFNWFLSFFLEFIPSLPIPLCVCVSAPDRMPCHTQGCSGPTYLAESSVSGRWNDSPCQHSTPSCFHRYCPRAPRLSMTAVNIRRMVSYRRASYIAQTWWNPNQRGGHGCAFCCCGLQGQHGSGLSSRLPPDSPACLKP